jgi:hypothetical protein
LPLSWLITTYGVFQSTVNILRAMNEVYGTVNIDIPRVLYHSVFYCNH